MGNGGGVTRGLVLGNGGGTSTPGPAGMIGGEIVGEGEGDGLGEGDASSSGTELGVACATRHGVSSSASALALSVSAAADGVMDQAISVSVTATAMTPRTVYRSSLRIRKMPPPAMMTLGSHAAIHGVVTPFLPNAAPTASNA